MKPYLASNIIHNKIAYQIPYLRNNRRFIEVNHCKIPPNIYMALPSPFLDILTPLNPLHGGIGFTPINENSSPLTSVVTFANDFKGNVIADNRDIIHTAVFINADNIIEASPRYKKYNGRNQITEKTKSKTSVYISKFPFLNMMIVQEMNNLTGGNYNFIGTLNCLFDEKIVPPLCENDFFCSQMVLKALKKALKRYEKTPLLPNKKDVRKILNTIEPLSSSTTLPAEIKQAFDKIPNYFIVLSPPLSE